MADFFQHHSQCAVCLKWKQSRSKQLREKKLFFKPMEGKPISMDPTLYEAARVGDLIHLKNMMDLGNLDFLSQLALNQNTILHIATEFRQTNFVIAVTEYCPLLLWQANSFGDTALHVAARERFVDIVKFFIDVAKTQVDDVEIGPHDELLKMVNLDNDTALHCAARIGSHRSVELLVEADPDVCTFANKANESPLFLSVASGFRGVPDLIIKATPPIPAAFKGPNGLTALHPTLNIEDYAHDTIELLVKWMPQMIGEADLSGLTPLHYAALYGRTEAVKLFLHYDSCAIYLLDDHGESALHFAAFCGHTDALRELIKCRPDSCNLIDNNGRTILHAAVLGKKTRVVAYILRTSTFAKLINKQDKDGDTPLHLAALFKLYNIIRAFVRFANVDWSLSTTPVFHNTCNESATPGLLTAFKPNDSRGVRGMQSFANAQVKEMVAPGRSSETATANVHEKKNSDDKKKNSDDEKKTAVEVNMLVATLVATVTFAAGIAMPGGYVSDGPDEGLATLTTKAAFMAFVVFNTMAFYLAISSVLLHFHTANWGFGLRIKYKSDAASFTAFSIYAMVVAFATGTYVVLSKSDQLIIAVWVLFGCFALLSWKKLKKLYNVATTHKRAVAFTEQFMRLVEGDLKKFWT